jgi:N-carbamoyl-L-amino-acid hydrolase
MLHLEINSDRLQADFETVAHIGLNENQGISRLALSREDLEARAWFADQIEEAGLLIHDDDAGNLSGILRAADPDARTLMIGSHLDTVANAGRFDGTLGVLAGLECLRAIQEAGLQLPVNLEVMDFTDDEGAWEPMFGSLSLTGRLPHDILNPADHEQSAFRAALRRAGINPDHVRRASRIPESLVGYIELHVEQGVRLERAQTAIGVVTGVVGRSSYMCTFHGQAGHSGTASMYERKDALQGASLFVLRAHELVRKQFPDGTLNCGNSQVAPGKITIIPDQVCVTVEVRNPNEAELDRMAQALTELAVECADHFALTFSTTPLAHIPAVMMNQYVIENIEKACEQVGASHHRLASYASHNAQVMSAFTPSGLLFIPSVNGTSHHPSELSRWEDVVKGTNVLLHTILNLALA